MPDLSEFAKDKVIFKAELSYYTIDTGFSKTSSLGIVYVDSSTNREFALADDFFRQKYLISNGATNVGGIPSIEYKYNIGLFVNEILKGTYKTKLLNIYSAQVSQNNSGLTKFSDFFPSRVVLGGSGNGLKPKLKIYYIDK
jgi:hypothetical protein